MTVRELLEMHGLPADEFLALEAGTRTRTPNTVTTVRASFSGGEAEEKFLELEVKVLDGRVG